MSRYKRAKLSRWTTVTRFCDNYQEMQSELAILKARGLIPAPENSKPSPPEAMAVWHHYQVAAEEFDQLLTRIRSYRPGQVTTVDVAVGIEQLIGRAATVAAQVRQRAVQLGAYPNTFIRIGSEAAY